MNPAKLLPQFNRGAIETPTGFFKTLFRLHETGRECALPAIVEQYDRTHGIVYVKPLAKRVAETVDNKEALSDRPVYKVHAVRFMHGGCVFDAPIYKGDTGWIVAGDRNCKSAIADNSEVLQEPQTDEEPRNKGAARPDDNSLASFAWGFFIPDSWGDSGLSDSDGLVISGKGGKIEIRDDGIYVDGEKLGVKTLTYKTEDEEKSIKIFASDDIEIEGGSGGGGIDPSELAELSVCGTVIGKIIGDNDTEVDLVAGEGIRLAFDGTRVVVSAVFATSGFSGNSDSIADIRYDLTSHQIQVKRHHDTYRNGILTSRTTDSGFTVMDGGQAVEETV